MTIAPTSNGKTAEGACLGGVLARKAVAVRIAVSPRRWRAICIAIVPCAIHRRPAAAVQCVWHLQPISPLSLSPLKRCYLLKMITTPVCGARHVHGANVIHTSFKTSKTEGEQDAPAPW